ncbi:unnamed protein product [Effrenium voratum]|uniref:Pentatricopeptide repeat-containing protein, chloroplastic n=1 Tax=Effrenium voratum TaxID=2562239 RepID=A0AA36MUT1_9DINO|nr:unnamed protein product [Effrenium voratum]
MPAAEATPCDLRQGAQTISARGRRGAWQEALSLFQHLSACRAAPDLVCWNCAISACARVGAWRRSGQALSQLRGARLRADVVSYSGGITACEAHWLRALHLLRSGAEAALESDVVMRNGALRSCALAKIEGISGQTETWRWAVLLLGNSANTVSFNSAASACEKCSAWRVALRFAGSGRQDVITCNAPWASERRGGDVAVQAGVLCAF